MVLLVTDAQDPRPTEWPLVRDAIIRQESVFTQAVDQVLPVEPHHINAVVYEVRIGPVVAFTAETLVEATTQYQKTVIALKNLFR